ncbi:protein Lines homolog 1 isoform X2 [Cheilinus undulatus]|uniref:protein Lines homolog 1 isoform X2 n=1 Tax=Cheilinus undulatus TaxID=241271 RepID=UPI001BD598DA|nr:protein Lines homolog 1 isoform X2 [Cheilinus undulatus]
MEHPGGPGVSLSRLYRCILTGSCPERTPAEFADVILSALRGPARCEDGGRCHGSTVEQMCMSASLVERIACGLTSRSFSPAVTSYCEEVARVLFSETDVIRELVQNFLSDHLMVSHLSAKSVSASVFYFLQTSGTVSPVWRQTCEQAFLTSLPGSELDACLWSLTDILKRLLKSADGEIFMELLAAFDSSLGLLCSKFLLEDRQMDDSICRQQGASLYLLLELLEVLTASSSLCGAAACLQSQRITHAQCSALLHAAAGSSEYFVKKRAVLLLKRAVLQKAGEDWATGDVLLSAVKPQHISADTSLLAHSVLMALAADWLESLQVESASFFGGIRAERADGEQKSDDVMLRAVSLLVLKSAEIYVQSEGGTGQSRTTEDYGYPQRLWSFLERNSVHLSTLTHRCCWISVLFGDQDDDMMEAAKASLSIFLHHRRSSDLDDSADLDVACCHGNNPHCIFVLLLQSVSFDHSILLDFLISTETCFLEFLIRYLKCLTADWSGFTAACRRISSQQGVAPASCGHVIKPTTESGLRLVQYGSSEESETDDMEDSYRGARTSDGGKSRFSGNDDKQEVRGEPGPIGRTLNQSLHLVNKADEHDGTSSSLSARSGPASCGALERAVLCLAELRALLTRLQAKKLFPYNPTSLLKLLGQVENISQQKQLSKFNKTS